MNANTTAIRRFNVLTERHEDWTPAQVAEDFLAHDSHGWQMRLVQLAEQVSLLDAEFTYEYEGFGWDAFQCPECGEAFVVGNRHSLWDENAAVEHCGLAMTRGNAITSTQYARARSALIVRWIAEDLARRMEGDR